MVTARGTLWGGPPTLLIAEESLFPAISPDGRWVAALHSRSSSDPERIVIVPAAGGEPVSLGDLPLTGVGGPMWTPDGTALSFKCAAGGIENICVVPRAGGPGRQMTAFTEGTVGTYDWSSNGQLLVVRSLTASDLVVINVGKNQ